jgi:hypothetical protein
MSTAVGETHRNNGGFANPEEVEYGLALFAVGSRYCWRSLSARDLKEGTRVDTNDLMRSLQQEVGRWSAKPYESLRTEIKGHDYTDAEGQQYHVEVTLLEERKEYIHVMIAVCSSTVSGSCFHPVTTSFLVYKDGRVDKPLPAA